MSNGAEPVPKKEPAEVIGEIVINLIKGWPVYGAVLGIMWLFAQFYLSGMITEAIEEETLELPSLVTLTAAVQTNTNAVNRVDGKVEEVERDTKAILLHLAGQSPE